MRFRRNSLVAEGYGLVSGVFAGTLVALVALVGFTSWAAVLPVALVVATVVATGARGRRSARITAERHRRQVAKDRAKLDKRFDVLEALVRDTQATAAFSAMDVPYPLLLGGFALDHEVAATLAREVATSQPETVVELGSGTSTIIIGMQLARLGRGHLYSLEHEPSYASRTLRQVRALGLESVVTVLDAPLVATPLGSETYQWYRIPDEVAALPRVDLLLVDGPPQATDRLGTPRYPALPVFAAQLGPGSLVYVDDMTREAEQRMLARWRADRPDLEVQNVQSRHGLAILRLGGSA